MHQRSVPSMKNIDDSLVQTLQYTKTLPWICFVHVNMKNLPSQVGWFSKIAENFRTAQTAKATEMLLGFQIRVGCPPANGISVYYVINIPKKIIEFWELA